MAKASNGPALACTLIRAAAAITSAARMILDTQLRLGGRMASPSGVEPCFGVENQTDRCGINAKDALGFRGSRATTLFAGRLLVALVLGQLFLDRLAEFAREFGF